MDILDCFIDGNYEAGQKSESLISVRNLWNLAKYFLKHDEPTMVTTMKLHIPCTEHIYNYDYAISQPLCYLYRSLKTPLIYIHRQNN